ncbi:MAG: hypothetical protein Q9225_007996, partial [Loekoesia sp. 1 TL-2023]
MSPPQTDRSSPNARAEDGTSSTPTNRGTDTSATSFVPSPPRQDKGKGKEKEPVGAEPAAHHDAASSSTPLLTTKEQISIRRLLNSDLEVIEAAQALVKANREDRALAWSQAVEAAATLIDLAITGDNEASSSSGANRDTDSLPVFDPDDPSTHETIADWCKRGVVIAGPPKRPILEAG